VKSVASDTFWRLYHALPDELRREAKSAFRLFLDSPAHPGLSLERLRCGADLWSVRITRGYRAVGRKHGDTMIWFWIGSHSEFDKKFRA
jgi:hypothetical protein